MNKLVKLVRKTRIAKKNQGDIEGNKKDFIQNSKIIPQEIKSVGSMFDEKQIISLVKKRFDEDAEKIHDRVFFSVMQEIKAMEQNLGEMVVDGPTTLHPPIEKSVLRGTDFLEMLPRKKNRTALWRLRGLTQKVTF